MSDEDEDTSADTALSPRLFEKFQDRDAFLAQQGNLEEKSEAEMKAIYTALGLQHAPSRGQNLATSVAIAGSPIKGAWDMYLDDKAREQGFLDCEDAASKGWIFNLGSRTFRDANLPTKEGVRKQRNQVNKPKSVKRASQRPSYPSWATSPSWFAMTQLCDGKVDAICSLLESGDPIAPEARRLIAMAIRAGAPPPKGADAKEKTRLRENGMPFRLDFVHNKEPDKKKTGKPTKSTWLRDLELAVLAEKFRGLDSKPKKTIVEVFETVKNNWNSRNPQDQIDKKTVEAAFYRHRDEVAQWRAWKEEFSHARRKILLRPGGEGEIVRAVILETLRGLDRAAAIKAVASDLYLEPNDIERVYANHEVIIQREIAEMKSKQGISEEDPNQI